MRSAALKTMFAALLLLLASSAAAAPRTHVVAPGHTLGKIAKRYNVSIAELCDANGITRREKLKPGQKLVIPEREERSSARAEKAADDSDEDESREESRSESNERVHVVQSGQTLIGIAQQHDTSVEALCSANGIDRDTPILAGQELILPGPGGATRPVDVDRPDPASSKVSADGERVLLVPGAPPAYYYEPTGPGRKSLRPVIMYLHGRGGNPKRDCQRWARVARRLGWVVCPSGPADRGAGARAWNNNWAQGHQIVRRTLDALRDKYGRRVQLYGNTLIGFSEGAFVAMNVGVREPRAFNRWLILAADSSYWGGAGVEALQKRRATVRRVYLITGQRDSVSNGTDEVRRWLANAGVPTRLTRPSAMGHELWLERRPEMYRSALIWLQRGSARENGVAERGAQRGARER